MWLKENLSSICGSPKYSSAYDFLIASPIFEFQSFELITTETEWILPEDNGL